jgi:hypothetical protein
MNRPFRSAGFLFAILTALLVVPAGGAQASWAGRHCFDDHHTDGIFKRADARAYADVADHEGYEYGGGCWNDDNHDDTPGAPNSAGEGPDCSGLVFKAWELKATKGADGGMWWNRFQNIHGPYASGAFHHPNPGYPFHKLPNKKRLTTVYMDAFARNGHTGLIETNYGSSSGNDYINEAKCDACGTGVFLETYRFDADYVAVRREGWVPDCYPRCLRPTTAEPVVRVP